eukprot:gene17179-20058_t
MRLEQLLAYRELRAGVVAGRVQIAPTNCAYTPGVTHGTAHRLNQACQLDARRHLRELYILMEDKSDAFGRLRHSIVAQDLLRCGVRPDVAFRTIVFWAFALIHTITAAGLTAAYEEDHAGIQGDMFAQLTYLRRTLRPRLLTNDPSKEGVLGLFWRQSGGVWRPCSRGADALCLMDQGSRVPLIRLQGHTRNMGFELIVFLGHTHSMQRMIAAVNAVWHGALRGHMLASSCRTVHTQCVMGVANNFGLCNPRAERCQCRQRRPTMPPAP